MNYLNPVYEGKEQELQKQFLSNKPFPHLVLKNIFKEKLIEQLKKEIQSVTLKEKETDLFAFKQSQDLSSINNKTIKECYKMLSSKDFIHFIEQVTNTKLTHKIDASIFRYEETDHLLPHDDHLESRKVAFTLYLSKEKIEGGHLQFFEGNKIIKSIEPSYNTLVLFTVEEGKTIHQVSEVIMGSRYSIAGWFHA